MSVFKHALLRYPCHGTVNVKTAQAFACTYLLRLLAEHESCCLLAIFTGGMEWDAEQTGVSGRVCRSREILAVQLESSMSSSFRLYNAANRISISMSIIIIISISTSTKSA